MQKENTELKRIITSLERENKELQDRNRNEEVVEGLKRNLIDLQMKFEYELEHQKKFQQVKAEISPAKS